PKPAFNVFKLLHELGDHRLESNSENALVTERRDGSLVIAVWNYAEPGETVPEKTFHLDMKGTHAKSYRMQFLDPEHGSSLAAWKSMGSPVSPTTAQIRELIKASDLPSSQEHAI